MAVQKANVRAESDKLVEKGIEMFQDGHLENALLQFKKATKIDPENEVAWNNMGYTLKVMERFDEAIACYKKAVEIDEYYEEAWYNLGVAYIASGKFRDAKRCFIKALDIDPNDVEAVEHLELCNKKIAELEMKKREWMDKRRKKLEAMKKEESSKVMGKKAVKPKPKHKPRVEAKVDIKRRIQTQKVAVVDRSGDTDITQKTSQKPGEELTHVSSQPSTAAQISAKSQEIVERMEEGQMTLEGEIHRSTEFRKLVSVAGAEIDLQRELERQKMIEERMKALKEKIERESAKYATLRKSIEDEIKKVEMERDTTVNEMQSALIKEEVDVGALMVKSEIEKKIALEAGVELPWPKVEQEIEKKKEEIKKVEDEYKRKVEEKDRVLEIKKSQFDDVVKEEEEFLLKAKEEEDRLKRELEAIMRRISEYMDKELMREGIEF